jgi:hypothetical protein
MNPTLGSRGGRASRVLRALLPFGLLLALLPSRPTTAAGATLPESVWVEAETMSGLRGSNFSFQQEAQQTRGSWSIAGPGVAAEWTQGGESEFVSVAARADEPAGTTIGREIEIPVAGQYTLWVRYADYRGKSEAFGVRVRQGARAVEHVFGEAPVVDELDPMKLFWDWAFGWGSAPMTLQKGPARLELYTTGPTGARRQVDCLCLTTDAGYQPAGRRKPRFAAFEPLRAMQQAGMRDVAPLLAAPSTYATPKAWSIAGGPPSFLWNVKEPWLAGLTKPAAGRIDAPYWVDSALQNDFLAAFQGQAPPVYGHPLSGAVLYVPGYPAAFAGGSPVADWLARNPQRRLGILLNYGEPTWPAAGMPGSDRPAARAGLQKLRDRFVGFISGESILHGAPVDPSVLERRVRAAKSRADILAALRELYSAAAVKKFSEFYGAPVSAEEAWAPVVSCLSADMEAYSHALLNWGERRLGHEGTGNSPTLARRLAFMRGAARQFGGQIVDYQSANLGDASMTLARSDLLYPATSRYVLDNQYDIWSGAGINWVLKDYLLFHLAGADAFYHEEGHDLFWKPGGGAAGDGFPVQLSPRGRVTDAVQRLVQAHPRGVQYTPVAFLLDEAHGWAQEHFGFPTAFDLDPAWNPGLLTPGPHEAGIRGWFDVAYYPAPETQNEPASAIRQTYVNGVFGDLFDVVVTAPKRTASAATYPVLIAAGEVPVSEEWGRALRAHVQAGGTLVVCAEQLSGPGVKELGLPAFGAVAEAAAFTWAPTGTRYPSNTFRYHALAAGTGRVLAAAPDGTPICVAHPLGKGQVIAVAAPLGLGIDQRPVPLLGLLLRHLTQGLAPVRVTGDVEWTLNRTDDGGWLVALFNNRGVIKPQHGLVAVDYDQAQRVTLRVPFAVAKSAEWVTETPVPWREAGDGATTTLTVPAGAVRWVWVVPRSRARAARGVRQTQETIR